MRTLWTTSRALAVVRPDDAGWVEATAGGERRSCCVITTLVRGSDSGNGPSSRSRVARLGYCPSNAAARAYRERVQAAFFDLDKTVIAKAALMAFGRPLHDAGYISRWLVLRSLYGQLVFRYFGADEARMKKIR